MLQNLTEEIAECYHCASQCRERAALADNPDTKQEYLDMERRWLNLARSYEFAERLSDFTTEARRRTVSPTPSSALVRKQKAAAGPGAAEDTGHRAAGADRRGRPAPVAHFWGEVW
jgi:hypothetical protein